MQIHYCPALPDGIAKTCCAVITEVTDNTTQDNIFIFVFVLFLLSAGSFEA